MSDSKYRNPNPDADTRRYPDTYTEALAHADARRYRDRYDRGVIYFDSPSDVDNDTYTTGDSPRGNATDPAPGSAGHWQRELFKLSWWNAACWAFGLAMVVLYFWVRFTR